MILSWPERNLTPFGLYMNEHLITRARQLSYQHPCAQASQSNMPNENLTPYLPLLHSTSVNLSEVWNSNKRTELNKNPANTNKHGDNLFFIDEHFYTIRNKHQLINFR